MAARQELQSGGAGPASSYDQMPPQDIDAERAVLGAMLMRPQSVGAVMEILCQGTTDLFLVPAHQIIFEAILKLFGESKPLDRVTLMSEIGRLNKADVVGGDAYLTELVGVVPTSVNADWYAQIVLDKAIRRQLIDLCARVTKTTYTGRQDIEDLLDLAEKEIFALNERRQTNRIYSVSELLNDGVARIEQQIKSGTGITGLPTGYKKLDETLAGLQPSDMIVLAARPSVGKTAFALNIAANAAIHEKKSVLLFSLEMAKEQLVQRLLCLVGRVDSERLRSGFLAGNEFRKVQEAAGKLTDAKLYLDESAGLTPLELRSKARRHATQHTLDLIIIDYMQLMHTAGRAENRQNEISDISRSIKGLARELHVPIMTLSQLSREADKDDRGTPKLSHLRESGAIEQDADVVIILARPPAQEREEQSNTIFVNIAKQRNGPTGRVELLFLKNTQRFENLDRSGEVERRPPPSGHKPPPPPVSSPSNNVQHFEPDEPYFEEEEDIPFD